MKRFVRRALIVIGIAIAALVLFMLIGLPIVVGALAPTLIRNAGVDSPQLSVKMVTGPAIFGGVVDSLTLSSGPLDVAGRFRSGDTSIVLRDANLTNNTFGSLVADAADPVATMASGEVVSARSLHAQGPADTIVATARFSVSDLQGILALPVVAKRLDFQTLDLSLGDGLAYITDVDGSFEVQLSVNANGQLLLSRNQGTPTVIWAASGPDAQDWSLTGVTIDSDGITATARFDGTAFLSRYPDLDSLLGGFVPSP